MKRTTAALLALMLSASVMANVADKHDEMGSCEACHQDGAPSEDLTFENNSCVDCHGGLADMDEDHSVHDGNLSCSDCHVVHDEAPASESCANCH